MTHKPSSQTVPAEYVEVVFSPHDRHTVSIKIPTMPKKESVCAPRIITVQDAIIASQIIQKFPEINMATANIGIWGRKTSLTQPIEPYDRIEIYRPLLTDPKETRRLRYRKQGPVQSRHRPGYKGP